jgi:ABC-2 type transport system permease protein
MSNPVFRRIFAIAKKESLHILRDLRSLGIVLLMPVVMLLLYGYALNFDIRHVRLTVVDHDRTSSSREYAERFTASGYFRLVKPETTEMRAAEERLKSGRTTLVLVIPERFATDLALNRTAVVQMLADGTDPNTAQTALGYAVTITAEYSGRVALERINRMGLKVDRPPGVRVEPRIWFNQEMRSAYFIVPGLISIIMMLTAALLTSLTIVREKESGTFEQLASTPIRPIELMIGKLLPYILIGFADVILITVLGGLIFSVPFRGNLLLLGIFSLFFIFCALGIGLLISAVAPNQAVAVIGTVFVTVLPSILLSGFVFPVDSMPWFVRPFSYIVPAKYFLSVLRTLFLKEGAGWTVLARDGAVLVAYGILLLGLASKRMRKSLE